VLYVRLSDDVRPSACRSNGWPERPSGRDQTAVPGDPGWVGLEVIVDIGAASTPEVDHGGVDRPRQRRAQETHGLRDINWPSPAARERGLGGAILDNFLQRDALHSAARLLRLQLPFCHPRRRCQPAMQLMPYLPRLLATVSAKLLIARLRAPH